MVDIGATIDGQCSSRHVSFFIDMSVHVGTDELEDDTLVIAEGGAVRSPIMPLNVSKKAKRKPGDLAISMCELSTPTPVIRDRPR